MPHTDIRPEASAAIPSPTRDLGTDEPYGAQLFLAALSGNPTLITGLPANPVAEDRHENHDAPDNHMWCGGTLTRTHTFAFSKRYKPFLTFQLNVAVGAHAAHAHASPQSLSRREFARLTVVLADWENTPAGERPARFPAGGLDEHLRYEVRTSRVWRVHGHAHTPHIPPDGYAMSASFERGVFRPNSSGPRVRNLPTLDDAWAYARHAIDAIDPSNPESMGMAEAVAHYCPNLRA